MKTIITLERWTFFCELVNATLIDAEAMRKEDLAEQAEQKKKRDAELKAQGIERIELGIDPSDEISEREMVIHYAIRLLGDTLANTGPRPAEWNPSEAAYFLLHDLIEKAAGLRDLEKVPMMDTRAMRN